MRCLGTYPAINCPLIWPSAVSTRFTYEAYVVIPEIVRREYTVREIKILHLCPADTLPARDPNDCKDKIKMAEPATCAVCGIQYCRDLLSTERTCEKHTCGSIRCVKAIKEWLERATPLLENIASSGCFSNAEEEVLTFLKTDLYDYFRSKWHERHRIPKR